MEPVPPDKGATSDSDGALPRNRAGTYWQRNKMTRNHEIRIKVSEEEMEKIKRKAQEVGMGVSSFLRFLAVKSKINVETEE